MMSSALKDVTDTNAYLAKLKASCKGEQFGKIAQQQAAALAKRLVKSCLECHEGTELIEKVLEGPWDGADRDLLVTTVNDAVMKSKAGSAGPRPKQSVTNMLPYFTAKDIQALQGPGLLPGKLQVVATRMWRLGVHLPTEGTSGQALQILGLLLTS